MSVKGPTDNISNIMPNMLQQPQPNKQPLLKDKIHYYALY